jgi:hypothetical protein
LGEVEFISAATFSAFPVDYQDSFPRQRRAHTSIDICYDNLGSFICEETGAFSSNTLAGASDDCYLASEKALRKIKMR